MSYTYQPGTNELQSVTDAVSDPLAAAAGYAAHDRGDYGYHEPTGNLTYDPSRDLTTTYNYLNLPQTFTHGDGSTTSFLYTAEGVKLQEITTDANGAQTRVRDCLGPAIYEDGFIQSIQHAAGRVVPGATTYEAVDITSDAHVLATGRLHLGVRNDVELLPGFRVDAGGYFKAERVPCYGPVGDWQFEYFLTDHLGNNRVLFSDLDGDGSIDPATEVLQENHYYAFGMEMEGAWSQIQPESDQRYRYNGKELNEDLGLYDYGARWYDPAVGRFTGVDKFADDIMQIDKSPYAYAWNDPINITDPDGNCPMCLGAVVGGLLDYGTQVAVNLASGDDLGTALTDIDKTSIAVSAVAGATGVGLIARAGKVVNGKTLQAAEAVIDGTVNAAQQLATTGEIDIEQVAVGVMAGQVIRTPVKEKVKASRAPGQKQLDGTAQRAERIAKNSEARNNPPGNASPSGRPAKTARLQSEAQGARGAATRYSRSTVTRAAASGVAASGGTVRIWNAATNEFQEIRQ